MCRAVFAAKTAPMKWYLSIAAEEGSCLPAPKKPLSIKKFLSCRGNTPSFIPMRHTISPAKATDFPIDRKTRGFGERKGV